MRDMYVFEGLDEQKVLKDARDRSKGDYRNDPEIVQVHYHKKEDFCSGKKHLLYKEGYAQEPGSGPQ